ncbi:MAG: 54S ribosomal protein L17 mitochondrial [Candelina mexicana]|nr:MAG: 54S ribosomal protein L17 mitochondrial [Candelina mexicana]
MSLGNSTLRRNGLLIGASTKDLSTICKSCRASIARRYYASTAAAVAESPSQNDLTPPVTSSPALKEHYALRAGVVLSRPPVLTRDLTPFEKAFFLYQRRLNERLALPFTRYFYYPKGTPADADWKRKFKERQTPARDIGVYSAYGKEGWNDEVLVGAEESEPEKQVEALVKDAEGEREIAERPMPRVTDADKTGDQKSLNRKLARSLYLLVKGESGWIFPSAEIAGRENLHQAAERILVQSGGQNMNTWIVGHVPIGHYFYDYRKPIINDSTSTSELGSKTFFMKGRIMAGQANLESNAFGLSDFKWLAKEEVEKAVNPRYWSYVRNMLAER